MLGRAARELLREIALRGNRLTLGGDDEHVVAARAVVDELVELVEGGHEIGPDTVGTVLVFSATTRRIAAAADQPRNKVLRDVGDYVAELLAALN